MRAPWCAVVIGVVQGTFDVTKMIEIGMLTPPVGFNVYLVKNVVGESIPLETIFRGCFWFLGCQVVIMTLLCVTAAAQQRN